MLQSVNPSNPKAAPATLNLSVDKPQLRASRKRSIPATILLVCGTSVLISILALLIASSLYAQASTAHQSALKQIAKDVATDRQHQLEIKAAEIEAALRQIYQNARTISLIPAVRNVNSPNAPKNFKPGWNSHIFPPEAISTVQQIYNNLAVNTSVSEVYFIQRNFHPGPSGEPDEGETPFYMWDNIVVGMGQEVGGDGEKNKTADTPEEYEGEEYAWISAELKRCEEEHPKFTFTNLDDIPVSVSSIMRTCDNTQYTSKSRGNVGDAQGFIIAVPVYHPDGSFSGLISVITRINIWEAHLMGVPHLLITDSDKKDAQDNKWSLPEEPFPFLLVNKNTGLHIFDRRNSQLTSLSLDSSQLLSTPLTKADIPGWSLYLLPNSRDLDEPLAAENKAYNSQVTNIIGGAAFAIIFAGFIAGLSIYRKTIGNRTLLSIAESLSVEANHIYQASGTFSQMSEQLAEMLVELSSTTQSNVESAKEALHIARQTNTNARVGAERTHEMQDSMTSIQEASEEMRQTMSEIHASSNNISKILKTIDNISFQTNLLAINASIEAAHAGAAGSGFATVANEVGSLARLSAQSAKETAALIATSVDLTHRGVEMNNKVASRIASIAEKSQAVKEVLDKILRSSQQTETQVSSITQACRDQNTGIQHLSEIATKLEHVATQDEMASRRKKTTVSLKSQARKLRLEVQRLINFVTETKSSGKKSI